MTAGQMEAMILDRIPPSWTTHDDLWRRCGSPQDQDSYHFDVAIVALSERRLIASQQTDRMYYARVS